MATLEEILAGGFGGASGLPDYGSRYDDMYANKYGDMYADKYSSLYGGGDALSAAGGSIDEQTYRELLKELAPVPELTPGDASSLVGTAADMSIGALGAAGGILDMPGSMVRDVLTLNNPFDQLLSPFNPTKNRITGREVFNQWGLMSKNDPEAWEWEDFGGFAGEVALDPLSYVGLGIFGKGLGAISKAGGIVKKAGFLEDLTNVGSRALKKKGIVQDLGWREARKTVKIRDILDDPNLIMRHGGGDKGRSAVLKTLEEAAGGSDNLAKHMDSDLGGLIRGWAPGFGGVGPALGNKTLARGMDIAGRGMAKSKVGRALAQGFDSAAGGHYGKFAQTISRLSTRYADETVEEANASVERLAMNLAETKDAMKAMDITDDITEFVAGVDPADFSIGELVKTSDMARAGRVMGQDPATGELILRYFDPEDLTHKTIKRSAVRDNVTVIGRNDDEALKHADDLIDSYLSSFANASVEEGFDEAMKSWRVGDILGDVGGTGNVRMFETKRLANLAPEQVQILRDKLGGVISASSEATDAIHALVKSKGYKLGTVGREGVRGMVDFFYNPRRVIKSQAERLEQAADAATKRPNFLSSPVDETARTVSTFTGSAAGRNPSTANVPTHILNRLYSDEAIIALEGTADEVAEAISEKLLKDPEYKKYLDTQYNREAPVDVGALEKHGWSADPQYVNVPDDILDAISRERHALDLGATIGSHRGTGQMYLPDMQRTLDRHLSEMYRLNATADAVFTTIADDAVESGAKEGFQSIYAALRKLERFDVSKKTLTTGEEIYQGQALEHLAKVMGLGSDQATLNRLASMKVSEDLVNAIGGYHHVTKPGPLQKQLIATLDRLTSTFKSNVTLPFLSFANRNLVSGQFVNISSGDMTNAADILRYLTKFTTQAEKLALDPSKVKNGKDLLNEIAAAKLIGDIHFNDVQQVGREVQPFLKGTLDETPGPFISGEGSALRRFLSRSGWGDAWGQAKRDVGDRPSVTASLTGQPQDLLGKPMRGTGRPRAAHQMLLAGGSKYNRHVEFMNRVPMYLFLRDKGFSPVAAAKRVRELQFDYSRLAPFEKKVMKRVMPFYTFSRKMAPLFVQTLADRPGGMLAQTIRLSNSVSTREHILPDYMADKTTIPNPFFKPTEEGAASYITGLGLAHEDPLSYMSGLEPLSRGDATKFFRRTFSEGASRVNPLIKGPAEYLTGQSFFQTGPGGTGRKLEDMDPTMGRILSNLNQLAGGKPLPGKPSPMLGSPLLEAAVSNSPAARYSTGVRKWTDPRKGLGETALGFATGLKQTTISPYQLDHAAKETLQQMAKERGYGDVYETPYIDRNKLVQMYSNGTIGESEFRQALKMQAYYNALRGGRNKEERDERRLKVLQKIQSAGSF